MNFLSRRERGTTAGGASTRRRMVVGGAALLAACVAGQVAAAPPAGYPSRTITLVVPYAPGSPPDSYSRLFAEKLRPLVGQTVIVENKPGALTTIGMGHVARSRPDGYTIVYGSNSSLAAAGAMFKSLSYDPVKDFSAIAVTQESPMILMSRPEDAKKGLRGMLEQMKREPGMHPIGGGAITQEVIHSMLQRAAGIDQPFVRYSGPTLNTDLMGGRLAIAISALSGVAPLVEAGKLNVLATTGAQRLTGKWSHLPTAAETVPGVVLTSWVGFWVPAGTPRPIIDFLHEKTMQVLKDREFATRSEETGGRTLFMSPEESDAFVKKEGPRWVKLLQDVGVQPQ